LEKSLERADLGGIWGRREEIVQRPTLGLYPEAKCWSSSNSPFRKVHFRYETWKERTRPLYLRVKEDFGILNSVQKGLAHGLYFMDRTLHCLEVNFKRGQLQIISNP